MVTTEVRQGRARLAAVCLSNEQPRTYLCPSGLGHRWLECLKHTEIQTILSTLPIPLVGR
jgi:hypothetical protein